MYYSTNALFYVIVKYFSNNCLAQTLRFAKDEINIKKKYTFYQNTQLYHHKDIEKSSKVNIKIIWYFGKTAFVFHTAPKVLLVVIEQKYIVFSTYIHSVIQAEKLRLFTFIKITFTYVSRLLELHFFSHQFKYCLGYDCLYHEKIFFLSINRESILSLLLFITEVTLIRALT